MSASKNCEKRDTIGSLPTSSTSTKISTGGSIGFKNSPGSQTVRVVPPANGARHEAIHHHSSIGTRPGRAGAYILELHYERDDLRAVATHDRAEIKRWQNEAGLARAQVATLQTSKQTLTEFYGSWVDSLTEQLSISSKHLESALSVGSVYERYFEVPVRDTLLRDTVLVPAQTFRKRDRWSLLEGTIVDMELAGPTLGLSQKYYDSISVVSHLNRVPGIQGWLFGKRELTTDAINHNPYSTFTGMRHWQKAVRPLKFGIGPFVGYDPVRREITYGVSLHYSLIQF